MTTYEGYSCLGVRVERGVAFVTIDHPPINLLDLPLIVELDRVGDRLATDEEVRVVVLQSADPEGYGCTAVVQLPPALAPSCFPVTAKNTGNRRSIRQRRATQGAGRRHGSRGLHFPVPALGEPISSNNPT